MKNRTSTTVSKEQSRQSQKYDIEEQFVEEDFDKLYDLELDELDNIVSFADNMATELALKYTQKLKNAGKDKIDKVKERKDKMLKQY